MKNVFILILGVIIIIICTQFNIDLHLGNINIPITGQSFAVTLVGYLLYQRLGAGAVVIYLILGIIGLPIFADGHSGFDTIMSNSGGYLYGFVPAGYLCGYLHSKGWTSFLRICLAITLGTIVILAIGVSHLALKIGFDKALQYGLYPFIAGAIIKVVLASTIAYLITKTQVLHNVIPQPK